MSPTDGQTNGRTNGQTDGQGGRFQYTPLDGGIKSSQLVNLHVLAVAILTRRDNRSGIPSNISEKLNSNVF